MNGKEKKRKEYITPEYTRNAVAAFRGRNKTISFYVPNDTAERMKAAGIDNSVIKSLIMEELEKREKGGVHG